MLSQIKRIPILKKIFLAIYFKIEKILKRFWFLYSRKQYDFHIVHFAQEAEDIVLYNLFFNDKKRGFFVDVGAFHPQRFSNTYLFYLKGWQGINIEPNPEIIDLFNNLRPRDINLNLGVTTQQGTLKYYMFNEPALNIFDEQLALFLTKNTDYKILKSLKVNVIPLRDILEQYLPLGQRIDFMSIDCENFDLEVLQSNDWDRLGHTWCLSSV